MTECSKSVMIISSSFVSSKLHYKTSHRSSCQSISHRFSFIFYINVCSLLNLAWSNWTSSSDRQEWLCSLSSSKTGLRQNFIFSSAFLMASESGIARVQAEGSSMRSLVEPSQYDLNLYLSEAPGSCYQDFPITWPTCSFHLAWEVPLSSYIHSLTNTY